MDKKKSLYLTSGVLGLTTAAFLGMNANSAQAASKGTVNYSGGATTVWDSPNVGQKPQRYLQTGETVTIQAEKQVYHQTWYQVGDNQWVSGQYITPATDQPEVKNTKATVEKATDSAAKTTGTITINYQDGLTTVWAQPSFRQHTGEYLNYGQKVAIIDQKTVNGAVWYQLADQGWVPAEYATLNQATASTNPAPATTVDVDSVSAAATTNQSNAAATVVNAALSQVGTPYVWGGATPGQGLDCSGLVQYAYAQANVPMSHYTVAQESMGQKVSLDNLQPGDIVFWGNAGASYHDAIYVGNGQYVHAPQPGESVKVATISQYFMPSFAVRVF
ncbi:peptidoglycan endopeptidase [Bombilactobacillus bombi]|uniref:Peptidoglycan endopeptidase n=1 Tax=Bombilactobacillus bombi TaxID=1303590 RepID=A0A3R7CQE7_9LACO|nr:C40 family peptidase [Bombilactobacillus bombi]RHW52031.1 peptidoglycan endopeptidase [Bombilactobacillus bombi]